MQASLRDVDAKHCPSALHWRSTNYLRVIVAVYGVGTAAADPVGIGDGASNELYVFGGFPFADFFEGGVGEGLLIM